MMKIAFFQQQEKFSGGKVEAKWAKLIFSEMDLKDAEVMNDAAFQETSRHRKIGGVLVLEQSEASFTADDDAIKTMREELQREEIKSEASKLEVMLSADVGTFLRALKETTPDEFDPKFKVTEGRKLLCYGFCGEDKTVLLVTCAEEEDFSLR